MYLFQALYFYLCGLDSIELDGILDDFFVIQVARHCELAHQAFHITTSLQAEKLICNPVIFLSPNKRSMRRRGFIESH